MSGIEQQRRLHQEGYKIVSKALDFDLTSPIQALPLYRQGLMIFKEALALQFLPHEINESKILEDKICKNVNMIIERINFLEQKLQSENQIQIGFSVPSTYSPNPSSTSTPISSTNNSSSRVASTVTSSPNMRSSGNNIPITSIFQPNSTPKVTSTNNIINNNSNNRNVNNSNINNNINRGNQSNNINNNNNNNVNNNAKNGEKFPELRGIEDSYKELILREILDKTPALSWDDIVGLDDAKRSLYEMVILPAIRPELFTGLRSPPKGLLLFGPPGNGKTMIARAIAAESKATFFALSASSLVSKYMGESEKLVRTLFAIARILQPSIIFLDEIDSLLSSRSSNEHESSKRLKTEFLVQLEGAATASDDRIVFIGATNRPWDLDEAVRRRFVKRIYIPLPNKQSRIQIMTKLLKDQKHSITSSQFNQLANETENYSASDLTMLCKDASFGPIRQLGSSIARIPISDIPPISVKDFRNSLQQIRPSVSSETLETLLEWNSTYGSLASF